MAENLVTRVKESVRNTVRSYVLGPKFTGDPAFKSFDWFTESSNSAAITETSMLSLSAVFRAVNLIASTVAELPLLLYRRTGDGGRERATNEALYDLLRYESNPDQSAFDVRYQVTSDAVIWGRGYLEIERDGVYRPVALWPLAPWTVARDQERGINGRTNWRVTNADGSTRTIDDLDLVCITGPLNGANLAHTARESLSVGSSEQDFAQAYFSNNCSIGGYIQAEGNVSAEARLAIRESIEKAHRGPKRAHKIIVLPNGLKFAPETQDHERAQLINARTFEINEVSRWTGVPVTKLAQLEHGTYSNVEAESLAWVTDGVLPWLTRWEQALSRRLLNRTTRQTHLIEHLLDGLLRADSVSRAQLYQVLIRCGAASPNDIAQREGLNPSASGDVRYVSRDLVSLDQAGRLPAASASGRHNGAEYAALSSRATESDDGWEYRTSPGALDVVE